MKHLLLALSVLLSTSLSALFKNVGGNTYFDIPSNWSTTIDSPEFGRFSFSAPSGGIGIYINSRPYSNENQSIYYEDYDALNTVFAPLLGLSELEILKIWTNGGLSPIYISDPVISNGPTINYNFYLLSSINTIYTSSGGNVYTYVVGHYIFWDGNYVYTARTLVGETATDFEKNELLNIINSGDSSSILNPLDDSDGDGISNYNEAIFYGSDPNQVDSNGDGINDDVITSLGGHPNWDLTSTLDYIGQNPSQFNLHSLEDITDLRAGSKMIEIHNGQANLSMEVEQSNDLGIWTTGGTASVQINVQPGEDKKFFRFKMNNSDFDGNDITLSVGNTEYDEAAIKAALAEQYGVPVDSLTLEVTNGN